MTLTHKIPPAVLAVSTLGLAALAVVLLPARATPSKPAQETLSAPSRGNQPPLPVFPITGQNCSTFGPQGWRIVQESVPNSLAVAMDMASADMRAVATFTLYGVAPAMISRFGGADFSSPGAAYRSIASGFGSIPMSFGQTHRTPYGFYQTDFRNAYGAGYSLWYTIPIPGGGYVLSIRTMAAADPARLPEAMQVAASAHCTVPFPTPPPRSELTRGTGGADTPEKASENYNKELGVAYMHDPQTCQNYDVTPATQWRETGPQGPGIYVTAGGGWEHKLEDGSVTANCTRR